MKKIFFLAAAITAFVACNNAPKTDNAQTIDRQTIATADGTAYAIDSSCSVTWIGSKPTGKHTGIFKLKEGSLIVKDNNLTAGSFTIDIASLTNLDLAADAENKGKLEGHLKSPDFFDEVKYPTAKFQITSVEPFKADDASKDAVMKDATHTIKGNLTIKDSTKNISFPAKVTVDGKKATAIADFKIDRTTWGMNYKGPNNPQDWFISKDVNIKLNIAASEK